MPDAPNPEPAAEPAQNPAPESQPVAAAPPPAAVVVNNGDATEEVLELRETLKQREQRINQLEDENRTLKTVPQPQPVPIHKADPFTALDWE